MGKTYEISKEQAEEIKEQRKKINNKQIDKRLHVVQLRGEGFTNDKIAEKLDTSPKVVSRWICNYVKFGIESLLEKNA